MRIKSFAKINLGIEILGKRDDGYHEIRTLFQAINLCDLIECLPHPGDDIILRGDDDTISWGETNLIHRAAMLLKEHCGVKRGTELHVNKQIPPGKGLGGGSSNAAMTLLGLNATWELGLGRRELMELGARLGADVPYFFEGGLCLGEGRGDRIIPLPDLPPRFCVLVLPPLAVSTASVYMRVPVTLTSQEKGSKIIRFLDSRDLEYLENDLEKTVFRTHPQIKAIKSFIQKQGSELSLMSGSGSAVFGLFSERQEAEKAVRVFEEEFSVVLAKTLPREEYLREVNWGVAKR